VEDLLVDSGILHDDEGRDVERWLELETNSWYLRLLVS